MFLKNTQNNITPFFNKERIYILIIFLMINFGALVLGGFFTGKGVPSDWYSDLIKAPWTPPGWVFGYAWTTIMICFSLYLSYLWQIILNKNILISLYIIQWILNVSWNPIFFYYHNILFGLFVIIGLTLIIGFFFIFFWPAMRYKSVLIFPYLIWLLIASSLNGYIFLYN